MPNALLLRAAVPATAGPSAPVRPGFRTEPDVAEALVRAYCVIGLLWSLTVAAVAALTPEGTGWRWGNPLTELWWYAVGWGSPATMIQLFGNLALLALPAAFAVRLWPGLSRLSLLIRISLAGGTAIETMQWLLPIGRVVSPIDALLNAIGAVLAGMLTTKLCRRRSLGTRGASLPGFQLRR